MVSYIVHKISSYNNLIQFLIFFFRTKSVKISENLLRRRRNFMPKEFNGFKLLEKRDLPDIRSVGYLYQHKKTGAEVLYLSRLELHHMMITELRILSSIRY